MTILTFVLLILSIVVRKMMFYNQIYHFLWKKFRENFSIRSSKSFIVYLQERIVQKSLKFLIIKLYNNLLPFHPTKSQGNLRNGKAKDWHFKMSILVTLPPLGRPHRMGGVMGGG